MKVEQLLSKSTFISSRTLTIFSATVLAILWTQTDLNELPVVRFLEGPDYVRYVIVLAVLVFMIAAHGVNFASDLFSYRAEKANEAVMRVQKFPEDLKVHSKGSYSQDVLKNTFDRADRAAKVSQRWTWIAKNCLHLVVPMSLALMSCLLVAEKIHSLTRVAQ